MKNLDFHGKTQGEIIQMTEAEVGKIYGWNLRFAEAIGNISYPAYAPENGEYAHNPTRRPRDLPNWGTDTDLAITLVKDAVIEVSSPAWFRVTVKRFPDSKFSETESVAGSSLPLAICWAFLKIRGFTFGPETLALKP